MSENAGTGMADKLAGVLITAGLVGCGFAGLALVQTFFEQRDTAILRTIPDVLVTWREGGDAFLPMMLIAIAPLILLPGAFGLSRGMPPVTRRARWILVAVTAALVATGVAWGGIAGRQEVGVATPFGAAWLYDGKAREHWSWGTAASVGIGCTNQKDETTGKVEPKLNYDVAFPSGREANLARETGDMKTLTARLAVIDANLRARGVARFVSTDPGCVAYYGRGLAGEDVVRLRGVLGR